MSTKTLPRVPALTPVANAVGIRSFSTSGKARTTVIPSVDAPEGPTAAALTLSARFSDEAASEAKAGQAQVAAIYLIAQSLSAPRFGIWAGEGCNEDGLREPTSVKLDTFKAFQKAASEAADYALSEAMLDAGVPEAAVQRNLTHARAGGVWSKAKSEVLRFFWFTGNVPLDSRDPTTLRVFGSTEMRKLVAAIPAVDADNDAASILARALERIGEMPLGLEDLSSLMTAAQAAVSAWDAAGTRILEAEQQAKIAAESGDYAKAILRQTGDSPLIENVIPTATAAAQPAAVH